MKISIIIPCFNEVSTIETVVSKIRSQPLDIFEIILVDDYSTDGSREVISKMKDTGSINKVVLQARNFGKGFAIKTAIDLLEGDIAVIQDADLEYDPLDLSKLVQPLLTGQADVVYGSRFSSGSTHRLLYYWHSVGNKFLTTLSNMMTNVNFTDMETGYKAFKVDVLKKISIEQKRFGFEPEITAKISRMKCRIYEIGISYHGRTYNDGKKITWKDGIVAIYCIFKYNLFK